MDMLHGRYIHGYKKCDSNHFVIIVCILITCTMSDETEKEVIEEEREEIKDETHELEDAVQDEEDEKEKEEEVPEES